MSCLSFVTAVFCLASNENQMQFLFLPEWQPFFSWKSFIYPSIHSHLEKLLIFPKFFAFLWMIHNLLCYTSSCFFFFVCECSLLLRFGLILSLFLRSNNYSSSVDFSVSVHNEIHVSIKFYSWEYKFMLR